MRAMRGGKPFQFQCRIGLLVGLGVEHYKENKPSMSVELQLKEAVLM